jgi:hypothetical protein
VQQLDGQAATLTEVLAQGSDRSARPLWSRVPNADLMKAALHALNQWIAMDTAPPSAPRLHLDGQSRLVRDADGRSLGGVRFAAYEVPAATNVGVTEEAPRLAGYHLDFSPGEMARRYGSLDRFVVLVTAAVQANLAQGFLLPEEAARVIDEARQVRFGT